MMEYGTDVTCVCPLCDGKLDDGQRLVFADLSGRPTGIRTQVHASCAQELRGEAEG